MANTMKAVVLDGSGRMETLTPREVPIPALGDGDVLVKVRAFAVVSGKIAQLQGKTDNITTYPRIPGSEFVGEVAHDPSGKLAVGTKVAAAFFAGMTAQGPRLMGLSSDGSYAEYISVAATELHPFESTLDWATLATIPGSFMTASNALFDVCDAAKGQTLLIRGGTSGVGLAAATLAKAAGMTVISTTRNPDKLAGLQAWGGAKPVIDEVVLDSGAIAEKLAHRAHIALHFTNFATLADTLQCAAPKGIVCMVGMLGDYDHHDPANLIPAPHPVLYIPHGVRLTSRTGLYEGQGKMQGWVDGMASGRYQTLIDKVFAFADTRQAYERRASQQGLGRVIVGVK